MGNAVLGRGEAVALGGEAVQGLVCGHGRAPSGSTTKPLALAESLYGDILTPYIRYSADAKKLYDDCCPLPILLPNSVPAVDYRKLMTSIGFPDRT
ncbi:hypothetical protein ACFYXL_33385 [Streptomyces tsukubensis]|uniref:hypothetical protein n=1 Tax=Streptomyces tsukubensis TaxID=83656 RepID=UPI0036C2F073